MKRFVTLFVTLTVLLSLPIHAHPGGIDANGGHYDRSTEIYHFHHGYPAHQHINGACPYNFDDQTGQNSGLSLSGQGGSSSSPGQSSGSSSNSSNTPEPATPKKSVLSDSDLGGLILASLLGMYVMFHVIRFFVLRLLSAKEASVKKEEAAAAAYAKRRKELILLYSGKHLSDLAPPPHPTHYIGSDGLPCSPGEGKWGDIYTVYISSPQSPVFHDRPFCSCTRYSPVNIVEVSRRRPFSRCFHRPIPSLLWYQEQKRILRLCKEYQITLLAEK